MLIFESDIRKTERTRQKGVEVISGEWLAMEEEVAEEEVEEEEVEVVCSSTLQSSSLPVDRQVTKICLSAFDCKM